jgi:hypothetical protein
VKVSITAQQRTKAGPSLTTKALEDLMDTVLFTDHFDTVLFTDHGLLVFAITTSAIALMFSVLGLATTHRMRSDIEHQFRH